ncbi:hypothetical protein VFPPC_15206 [Pochonia chlamydosporia 170]|uniref:Uncharacterized protein n=1 Tax=Pochonia chlamydosporia 170 TaxID=1380566 RepID=A0A179G6R4_METCM|nr:hypothetical protein VFPPC_15206 [Pochonia chlamydosporia 170]OAQ72869.1 hypothetical protein VFPPC_15206 [Pochonia chlamydosporia 170]
MIVLSAFALLHRLPPQYEWPWETECSKRLHLPKRHFTVYHDSQFKLRSIPLQPRLLRYLLKDPTRVHPCPTVSVLDSHNPLGRTPYGGMVLVMKYSVIKSAFRHSPCQFTQPTGITRPWCNRFCFDLTMGRDELQYFSTVTSYRCHPM